jgi:hypothetical protein
MPSMCIQRNLDTGFPNIDTEVDTIVKLVDK